jgi:hypothetical protein
MIRALPKLLQKNTEFLKADDDCCFCPHPFYVIIHGHPPIRRQKAIIFYKWKKNIYGELNSTIATLLTRTSHDHQATRDFPPFVALWL